MDTDTAGTDTETAGTDTETASLAPVDTRFQTEVRTPPAGQEAPSPGDRRRQPWAWWQRAGGLLVAAACAVAAAWYVPRVAGDDDRLLTGTVTSSGIIDLNFTKSGYLASVPVQVGQTVHKGQVLAAEYAPATDAMLTADKAAIASDQAKLAMVQATPVADQQAEVAADQAQLAKDKAQLATDRVNAAATQIIAPSSGTVIAVNGQPGETVSSAGIRTGLASSPSARASQGPLFSLLPEGPQSGKASGTSASALPVVVLRTSANWHVVALVAENAVSRVRAGQEVTISVPAAHVRNVRGRIDEVLPTPTSTSEGTTYQAVVGIVGRQTGLPLDGMAADVQLSS